MNDKSVKKTFATFGYAFKTIIWPRKKLLFLGLILIMIDRLAGLVLPGSSKYLIDNVIGQSDINLLYILLLVVAVSVIIQAVTSYFLTRLLSIEGYNLILQLRTKIQKKMIYLPVKFFDDNRTGELVSRVMADVEGVRSLIGTGLVQFFGGILTSIAALVVLFTINANMTLYALLPLLIFSIISLKAFSYIRPVFRRRREINAEVSGRLTETLNGIRVVKGFHAEHHETKVFSRESKRLFLHIKKTLTSTSLLTSAAILLLGLATVAMMGIGGTMIIEGEMTVGDFFAFILFLGFLISPIAQMTHTGSLISEALAGLDRMKEILNLEQEGNETNRTIILNGVQGNILFKNVSFSYIAGQEVLKDISFSVPSGTVTALVGSSGSGKSTIAGLTASFLKPDKGNIKIDDFDLSRIKLDSYRALLGVVFQDDFLFEGTIKENILFAKPNANGNEFKEAIKAAHVKEFVDQLENGTDTIIGERGVKLSGGQRQRVAIARALLANPRILILDEATSHLDSESEVYIQESLSNLMKGRTTLVIAHRLSTIRRADQILVIEKGRIAEKGTHDSLLEKKGRYFQLYTYQARI